MGQVIKNLVIISFLSFQHVVEARTESPEENIRAPNQTGGENKILEFHCILTKENEVVCRHNQFSYVISLPSGCMDKSSIQQVVSYMYQNYEPKDEKQLKSLTPIHKNFIVHLNQATGGIDVVPSKETVSYSKNQHSAIRVQLIQEELDSISQERLGRHIALPVHPSPSPLWYDSWRRAKPCGTTTRDPSKCERRPCARLPDICPTLRTCPCCIITTLHPRTICPALTPPPPPCKLTRCPCFVPQPLWSEVKDCRYTINTPTLGATPESECKCSTRSQKPLCCKCGAKPSRMAELMSQPSFAAGSKRAPRHSVCKAGTKESRQSTKGHQDDVHCVHSKDDEVLCWQGETYRLKLPRELQSPHDQFPEPLVRYLNEAIGQILSSSDGEDKNKEKSVSFKRGRSGVRRSQISKPRGRVAW